MGQAALQIAHPTNVEKTRHFSSGGVWWRSAIRASSLADLNWLTTGGWGALSGSSFSATDVSASNSAPCNIGYRRFLGPNKTTNARTFRKFTCTTHKVNTLLGCKRLCYHLEQEKWISSPVQRRMNSWSSSLIVSKQKLHLVSFDKRS